MNDAPLTPPEPEVNEGRPWLAIFLNEDTSLKVTGHINDKILAYGLLGAARDAIARAAEKTGRIERVQAGRLVNWLRSRE